MEEEQGTIFLRDNIVLIRDPSTGRKELFIRVREDTSKEEITNSATWGFLKDIAKSLDYDQGTPDTHEIIFECARQKKESGFYNQDIADIVNFHILTRLCRDALILKNLDFHSYKYLTTRSEIAAILEAFGLRDSQIYIDDWMQCLLDNEIPFQLNAGPIDKDRVAYCFKYPIKQAIERPDSKPFHIITRNEVETNSEFEDTKGMLIKFGIFSKPDQVADKHKEYRKWREDNPE